MLVDYHNHLAGAPARDFVESYLRGMDRVGLDKAVFYTWVGKGHDGLNALTRVVKDFAERLMAFYVPPLDAKAEEMVQDLDRYVNQGFKGLKLIPPVMQMYPNDSQLYPLYEKAQELGVPVNIHCGAIYNNPKRPNEARVKYGMPILIDDVARDFPELKIGVAHAGRPFIEQTIALAVDTNVYVDMTWSQLALGLYPETMKKILMAFGPDRIVYGSDTGTREGLWRPEDFEDVTTARCERMFQETMHVLRTLEVDQASMRKIMGGNATRLLKL